MTYDSAAAELTLAAAVMQAHDVYHMSEFGRARRAALAAVGRQRGRFGGSLIDITDSFPVVIVFSG